jgi:hypothetical protein
VIFRSPFDVAIVSVVRAAGGTALALALATGGADALAVGVAAAVPDDEGVHATIIAAAATSPLTKRFMRRTVSPLSAEEPRE